MAYKTIIVKEIEDLLISASERNDKELVKHGILRCNKALKSSTKALKNDKLKLSEKQKLISYIAKLTGFRVMFKSLPVVGRANKRKHPNACRNVKWEDIESAFKNRYLFILT